MKEGDVVQFDRKSLLLGIVEEVDGELWVRFLPEIYSSRRSLDNCLRHDKLWKVSSQ